MSPRVLLVARRTFRWHKGKGTAFVRSVESKIELIRMPIDGEAEPATDFAEYVIQRRETAREYRRSAARSALVPVREMFAIFGVSARDTTDAARLFTDCVCQAENAPTLYWDALFDDRDASENGGWTMLEKKGADE